MEEGDYRAPQYVLAGLYTKGVKCCRSTLENEVHISEFTRNIQHNELRHSIIKYVSERNV